MDGKLGVSNESSIEENKNYPEIILERTLAIFKTAAWKKEVALVDILMKDGITVTNVNQKNYRQFTTHTETIC